MPTLQQRLRHRLHQEFRARTSRPLQRPSFTYKVLEQQRERRAMRGLGTRDPAYLIDAKDDAHAWAKSQGIRTPLLIALLPTVSEIDWSGVGDAFVLKPARGTSSRGVMLLRRSGEAWRELISDRVLGAEDVVREYQALSDVGTVSPHVVLESLVVDPRRPDRPPVDYKVAMFYGVVGFIEAKRSRWLGGGWRNCWNVFGPDWESWANPFNEYWADESIEPPVHAEELLAMAQQVSLAVPRPFLRVDLFDSVDGPVFGEVTPEPGGEYVPRPDLDRRLGQQWEDAEVRLRIRAARAGLLTPVGVEPKPDALDVGLPTVDSSSLQ